ncbi:hypothetical protein OAR08_00830 [Flavobacteriaceae bacterium]|nr:hypothetical protein [Flavobacteriaceae bacterium]
MWKLKKEEYLELCSLIGEKLKIESNWVWDKESKNHQGKYHQFNGLKFNSSTISVFRFYIDLRKVEIFKEIRILNVNKLEDSESEFLGKDTLIECFNEYSKSKVDEIKSLVEFGLYEQGDLDKLSLRLNSFLID